MRRTWISAQLALALGAGALTALFASPAEACTNQQCAYGGVNPCYTLTGYRWCQVTYGYNPPYGRWTPVNSYNHTRYAAVQTAWARWNAPPNGPTNSVYLYSDGKNHASHDLDYWEASSSDWWWGVVDFPGGTYSGGCINRGGGRVRFNVWRVSASATWQRWLAIHETGHGIGAGHVCGCADGRVMNPCTECSYPDVMTWCDGKAANALYH